KMCPPQSVKTWPTPACLSTRATSSPPVRSATALSVSWCRSAVADQDERCPEERVRRLELGPDRGLRAPQRLRLADGGVLRLRGEHPGREIDRRPGGDRPVRHEQGPCTGVEERAGQARQ